MRHWLQLATRNWRVKRVRTAGAVLAIALGTGAVVWVTCCYESVRRTVLDWAASYVGGAQVTIQSPLGRYDTLPQRILARVEGVANVAHVAPLLVQRLPAAIRPRAAGHTADQAEQVPETWVGELDLHGIDLAREFAIRDWNKMLSAGRMLTEQDEYACVLEASLAREAHADLGDEILLWPAGLQADPVRVQIVGLIERRRIARFLKGIALIRLPVLQQMCNKQALVTSVDIALADRSLSGVERATGRIRALVQSTVPHAQVRSAAARLAQVANAQEQQEIVLVLLSCVAMLTALFIILSTLSMGMVERVAQMGLLRCVGTTRGQLVRLTIAEVLPLAVVGIALGIPIGLGLTALSVWLVPEYVGQFTTSYRGIALASVAGLATGLLAAVLPAVGAASVSPLEATRPRARQARFAFLILTTLLAVAGLIVQLHIMRQRVQRDLHFLNWSATAVVLLYLIYALAAPLLVWVASRAAVPAVAALLGLRVRLLQDQVGRAVWRSAGICCGLMVGLSLIVGLVVFNASFRAGWQFPRQFPEGYIWSYEQIDSDVAAAIREVGGVREFTVANAINVVVEERPVLMEQVLFSISWFLGVDPDSFFDMAKLKFIDGDEETARQLLKQGGYVLVAADFANTRRKGVREVRDEHGNILISNTVRVWFNEQWKIFRVAGVIDSPALDIAASYFQVETEAHVVGTGSVIGTNADLEQRFGVRGSRLILLNFDLPPEEPPPDWEPPPSSSPRGRPTDDYYNRRLPKASRYQFYRENALLEKIRDRIGARGAFYGTARELKDQIDQELTRMTYLLSAVPAVALLVAALGVANLMTANVASRTKQIAILRAIGATRSLVLRLVIGEALVLGLLGSGLGLALGLHLAWDTIFLTHRMWGLTIPLAVPWPFVSAAAAITVGLCMLAGLLPARHASRTNIIAALHVA